ncbi:MAG: hypothetical protein WCI51_17965 [Lentisphaerota bacterium]
MKNEISGKTAHGVHVTTVEVNSSRKPNDIVFRCKLCNKKYRLAKDYAGIEAECAKCKKTIVVPRHSDLSDENLQDKIIFRCHECSQKYRLPRIYANQKAKCSRCHSFFIIPEQSDVAQPIPANGKSSSAEKTPVPPSASRPPADKPSLNADVQNIRDEMGISNSRTQTSVEIAGENLTLVKYVLVPPVRNIFNAAIQRIQQFFSQPRN